MRHAGLTGGSRKGRPNKFNAVLRAAIAGTFEELGGQAWLTAQAKANPLFFLPLLLKSMPAQLDIEAALVTSITDLTDEELYAIAGAVTIDGTTEEDPPPSVPIWGE